MNEKMHEIINKRLPGSFGGQNWATLIFDTWIDIEKRTNIKLMSLEQEIEILEHLLLLQLCGIIK